MKIYDITLPLKEGMVVYPGDPKFTRRIVASLKKGDSCELSILTMGSHTGTHIDAPAHMLKGTRDMDGIPPDALIGPAKVFDLRNIKGHIEARHLKKFNLGSSKRVLFRTKNSARWKNAKTFDNNFAALTGDAAEFLVTKKVKLAGIDGLSIDRRGSGTHPAHMALLGAGVVIIEGLNLDGIRAGSYQLFCGPLKVAGGDGAPARVFLTEA